MSEWEVLYNVNVHVVVGGLSTILHIIQPTLKLHCEPLTICQRLLLLYRQLWVTYRWNKRVLLSDIHV